MNSSRPHYLLGFFLALAAAAMWGTLPVALKELLTGMDTSTIVWYRVLTAFLLLFAWLASRGQLPKLLTAPALMRRLLIIASLSLCLNFFLFNYSLNFVNGETSEAVIQLTTLLLILGGVVFFREPFTTWQKIGTLLIVIGLLVFFHDRLTLFTSLQSRETLGVLSVFVAAIAWTIYALLQKWLLHTWTTVQILFVIYLLSSIVLFPFTSPASLLQLSPVQLAVLLFCCLNTLVAYGCFAEAIKVWDASKVSAVLALAPLFTVGSLELMVFLNPDYAFSDRLDLLALSGVILLITGSILTALMPAFQNRYRQRDGVDTPG